MGLGGNTSGVRTRRLLGLLSVNACRTTVEDEIRVTKLWDTFDILVGIAKVVVTGMTEMLMPQKAFSGSLDEVNRSVHLDAFVEREPMALKWSDREI